MTRRPVSSPAAGERRRTRRQLALEAARLMDESGFRDPVQAVRKAAARLCALGDPSAWPDAREVGLALQERRRLLLPPGRHDEALEQLRRAAVQAMRFFEAFAPRAAGAVVDGGIAGRPVVQLHLHSDDAEAVPRHLADRRVAARPRFRRVFDAAGRAHEVPLWQAVVDGIDFELLVLPEAMLRQPPRPRAGEPAMPRATLAELQARATRD